VRLIFNPARLTLVVALALMLGIAPSAMAVRSDGSGSSCSPSHAFFAMAWAGGLHSGDRKYLDVQQKGTDGPWLVSARAKRTAPRKTIVCKMVVEIFDRYEGGRTINAHRKAYYPRHPGLSVRKSIRLKAGQLMNVWAYGRLKN
jgi:hypothetical protein